MEDIINKVCIQLTKDTHVIGIVSNCDYFSEVMLEDKLETSSDNRHINLCVVSKETGNQKTIYMENEYVVCLHWLTEKEFISECKHDKSIKMILYDRLGTLRKAIQVI